MSLQAGDALLVVDIQNDFCPGGALGVSAGDEVIPVLNRWIGEAGAKGGPVFATRAWHPADHISYRQRDPPCPRHLLQQPPGPPLSAALSADTDQCLARSSS